MRNLFYAVAAAILGTSAVANVASRRISEKTGMRVIATVERDYVSGRLMAEIWEITAEEWREKRVLLRAELRR